MWEELRSNCGSDGNEKMVERTVKDSSLKYERQRGGYHSCAVEARQEVCEALHLAAMISWEEWLLFHLLALVNSNDDSYKEGNWRTLVPSLRRSALLTKDNTDGMLVLGMPSKTFHT